MSISEVKFKTKEEFVSFVKNASKRKNEYMEARSQGVSASELKSRGFQTLSFS